MICDTGDALEARRGSSLASSRTRKADSRALGGVLQFVSERDGRNLRRRYCMQQPFPPRTPAPISRVPVPVSAPRRAAGTRGAMLSTPAAVVGLQRPHARMRFAAQVQHASARRAVQPFVQARRIRIAAQSRQIQRFELSGGLRAVDDRKNSAAARERAELAYRQHGAVGVLHVRNQQHFRARRERLAESAR